MTFNVNIGSPGAAAGSQGVATGAGSAATHGTGSAAGGGSAVASDQGEAAAASDRSAAGTGASQPAVGAAPPRTRPSVAYRAAGLLTALSALIVLALAAFEVIDWTPAGVVLTVLALLLAALEVSRRRS